MLWHLSALCYQISGRHFLFVRYTLYVDGERGEGGVLGKGVGGLNFPV